MAEYPRRMPRSLAYPCPRCGAPADVLCKVKGPDGLFRYAALRQHQERVALTKPK